MVFLFNFSWWWETLAIISLEVVRLEHKGLLFFFYLSYLLLSSLSDFSLSLADRES